MRRDTLEFALGIVLGGLLTAALPGVMDVATETDQALRSQKLGLWIVAIIVVALAVHWHHRTPS